MVPRDRIELPTRGFSDQIRQNYKINNISLLPDIIGFFYDQGIGKYLVILGKIR
jgi:hypothetical protein